MVSAPEVYGNYYESFPALQRNLEKTPAPVATGAMAGVVGAAGFLGYILTPSSRMAVSAVGSVVTGGLGLLGSKRIADERKDAAAPALAKMLASGLSNVTPQELASVATQYGVDKKQFQVQLSQLYGVFLAACLSSSQVAPSELSELKKLGELLCLSRADIGNALFIAGNNLYSFHRSTLLEDGPNDSKVLLSKFVFLAESVLAQDESEEGYRYETMRTMKIFKLSADEWNFKAEEAAMPFYDKVLSKLVAGQPFTTSQLSQIRDTFGIGDARAKEMHSESFVALVNGLLKPDLGAAAKFNAAAQVKLVETQELLEIAPEDAERIVQSVAAPLYRVAVTEALVGIGKVGLDESTSAQMSGSFATRQQELMLSPDAAKLMQVEGFRAAGADKLGGALTFLRAQNVQQLVQKVKQLVSFCEEMTDFMASIDSGDGDDLAVFNNLADVQGVKENERLSVYRLLLLNYMNGLKVDEEKMASLVLLRDVLGLSQDQTEQVYEAVAGPIFRKVVKELVGAGSFGAEQKAQLAVDLPDTVTSPMTMDVYTAELQSMCTNGKIINEEQSARLAAVRDFLEITLEQVYSVHEETCGETYLESVKQVMGGTGNIPDEYFVGLERLRERLALSVETANKLYAGIALQKMKPFGDRASVLIEAMSVRQEKATDASVGMGIDATEGAKLVTELLSLVEFASATRVLADDACSASINELDFQSDLIKEMYRQFLVEAFNGKAEQNQRCFASLSQLALVMGLDAIDVEAIHINLGKTIYSQYLTDVLAKGSIGPKDQQFLDQIKDALSLDATVVEAHVRQRKVLHISEMIENVFTVDVATADMVTAIRDSAAIHDVDLETDSGVSTFRLNRLFVLELDQLVEAGDIDPSEVKEMCESLKVTEETAQELLAEVVTNKMTGSMLQVFSLYGSAEHEEMLNAIEKLLLFASMAPGEQAAGARVSQTEKQEVFMLYQAGNISGDFVDDDTQSKVERLRVVLGLADASVTA